MAYFAKLGTGNIVENVISINNAVITDVNGPVLYALVILCVEHSRLQTIAKGTAG